MSLDISHETEAYLTDEARRQGTSVDALLERLVKERSDVFAARSEAIRHLQELLPGGNIASELPVLHLGPMGPLHRRDIYDDVR